MQDDINFVLNMGHGINIAYYKDLEKCLAAVVDNSKYKAMIRVKKPLVEKLSNVKPS